MLAQKEGHIVYYATFFKMLHFSWAKCSKLILLNDECSMNDLCSRAFNTILYMVRKLTLMIKAHFLSNNTFMRLLSFFNQDMKFAMLIDSWLKQFGNLHSSGLIQIFLNQNYYDFNMRNKMLCDRENHNKKQLFLRNTYTIKCFLESTNKLKYKSLI